ncbi:Hypothetical protein PHPALM_20692 [Phytophthora palmivora]|uniref:Uncharacterized protein n=1 Tax=Phytophthora palmivora TaxID=4796 RepID=A0A2P4XE83_9STRA|nr:Hypothetical protein PHPALM_20692 [Phytophthora palmivora]
MDEMAHMLENYAGGLQQSFESVFERVGQSLSQSAQVMRMMNEVMESAMLQNLRISSTFDTTGALLIDVFNRSQIMLGPTTIRGRLSHSETNFFSTTLDSLAAGQRVQLQASIRDLMAPIAGFIELECISPGTQQPLTKRSAFRVLYFQQGTFLAVRDGEDALPRSNEVSVVSERNLLADVRELLNLSPIDGILTDEQGRYRFVPTVQPNNDSVFYLSVKQGRAGEAAYQVSVSAAGIASTAEERRRQCQQIMDELEIESDDLDN